MNALEYPALYLFIDGKKLASGRRTVEVLNPANDAIIGNLPFATADDLDAALAAADRSFVEWSATPPFQRASILRASAAIMRERADAIAAMASLEQGKPIAQSKAEVVASAEMLEWFAEEARRIPIKIIPGRTRDVEFRIVMEPIGPVAAFTPWNFPASSPTRKIAAALAAGCTMVLKPSEETPATALAIAEALADAGLPDGVLNIVFGEPAEVAEHLIASPVIRKVSLTGSTRVGRILGELAARHLKPATLELGGHAPVIVTGDIDPDEVAHQCVESKFRNAGQVCISPTRFLVDQAIKTDFVEAMKKHIRRLSVGPPSDGASDVGPIANRRGRDRLNSMLDDAANHGASVWQAPCHIANLGNFARPSVVQDAPITSMVMNEEPFGPVAIVNGFDHIDEAIAEANRLPVGLAAYAFASDPDIQRRLAGEMRAGMVGMNSFRITIAETPFGGVGDSGFGREGGELGIAPYQSAKVISIRMS